MVQKEIPSGNAHGPTQTKDAIAGTPWLSPSKSVEMGVDGQERAFLSASQSLALHSSSNFLQSSPKELEDSTLESKNLPGTEQHTESLLT